MAKRSLIEQLNDAIDALMAQAPNPPADARIEPLARLALDLRDLPDDRFRARLKAELQTKALQANLAKTEMEEPKMQESKTLKLREGFHTITPYLAVWQPAELLEFLKNAVGAVETLRAPLPNGAMHAEVRIGDSMVMIGGAGSWRGQPKIMALHLYVDDVDAAYRQAIRAGAKKMYDPVNQEYGDREAGFHDPDGNEWYVATHLEEGKKIPEGLRSVTPFLHPKDAPQLIDFLKRAFGAQEISRYESSDGIVHHAIVQIGDSALEMGEAHGQFQPMPAMFYLYVEDPDAYYRRALQAGATSEKEPADQPYGDRVAAVNDSFGNTWYLATPIA